MTTVKNHQKNNRRLILLIRGHSVDEIIRIEPSREAQRKIPFIVKNVFLRVSVATCAN
jgi:hypothetical protein